MSTAFGAVDRNRKLTSDVNQTDSYITSCNKLVINRILAPQVRYWHSSDINPRALRHYCANIWLVALEAVNN